jgi:hypothetical protein
MRPTHDALGLTFRESRSGDEVTVPARYRCRPSRTVGAGPAPRAAWGPAPPASAAFNLHDIRPGVRASCGRSRTSSAVSSLDPLSTMMTNWPRGSRRRSARSSLSRRFRVMITSVRSEVMPSSGAAVSPRRASDRARDPSSRQSSRPLPPRPRDSIGQRLRSRGRPRASPIARAARTLRSRRVR